MPQTPLPPNPYKKMKKYKFIHPLTGESYEILCERITESGSSKEDYWWCLISDIIIAQFPQSYAMIKIE
jgi:hypothetical protein